MFSTEAITQAFSIWLGAAAIGLAFALLIAMFTPRSGQTAEAHGEHEAHSHDEHAHDAHEKEAHH